MNPDNKIKYIFSINCGRSGSQYLYKLLRNTQECEAFHEKKPIGNGRPMRAFLNGKNKKIQEIASTKAKDIESITASGKVYAETNHCFIKGYGWEIMPLLQEENVAIIILEREKELVIDSFLRVNSSPLDKDGKNWIILPDRKNPIIEAPNTFINPKVTYGLFSLLKLPFNIRLKKVLCSNVQNYPKLINKYERTCLNWYIEETAALTKKFISTFNKAHYYYVNVDDLNSPDKVKILLKELNLTANDSLFDLLGKPTNKRI